MTLTEIKKELYKQKPIAKLVFIRKGVAHYDATIDGEKDGESYFKTIFFEIPVLDMGDADLTPHMDAKLLNRWLVDY